MSTSLYLTVKALHIVAFTAWMAGLFYLPRLFVYHTRLDGGDPSYDMFLTMESKLLAVIMRPAMTATWLLGLVLAWSHLDENYLPPIWLTLKLVAVIAMTWFHVRLKQHHNSFASRDNHREERYYRLVNEVPTVLLIVIVALVVFQPTF